MSSSDSHYLPGLSDDDLVQLNRIYEKVRGSFLGEKFEDHLHSWIRTSHGIGSHSDDDDENELLNDLSARKIIERVLQACEPTLKSKLQQFLAEKDQRFIEATIPTIRPLSSVAENDKSMFWYWRVPKDAPVFARYLKKK